mmetsp:Transcript_13008/g.22952  ORF Transcript_13008/g.22952 Transcript_13008/m.22952 type:complete len:388 (-) Transcript_13008:571-1734(-)
MIFSRSTTLDTWTQDQLKIMAVGGNQHARQFFKQHGWDEIGCDKIESKYTSRAAQLYRAMLEKEAAKLTATSAMAAASASTHAPAPGTHASVTPGDLADFHHLGLGSDAAQAAVGGSSTASAVESGEQVVADAGKVVPRPASSVMSKGRLGAAKKPVGKLGLGIKKLDAKVDESMFDQAPAVEAPKVAASSVMSDPLATTTPGVGGTSAPSSRFAYDANVEPVSTVQRGKDGHITLGAKGGDFFSGAGMGNGSSSTKSVTGSSRHGSTEQQPALAATSTSAQTRFGGAKAISSKDYANADAGESEHDRNTRLSRFQGAAAISSADYYGRKESTPGSGDLDLSAADLVNRLSYQARQDLQVVKNMAGSVGQRLGGLATKFMSDMRQGY